jgi:hypothetical protein
MMNVGDDSLRRLNVEDPTCTHRHLALFQEQAGMPRMHRVQGLFSGI